MRRAPGEHRVDRLDRLVLLSRQPRHDRLAQELAAEHDAVGRRQVGGAVAVVADRLQSQGLDEGIHGGHRAPLLVFPSSIRTGGCAPATGAGWIWEARRALLRTPVRRRGRGRYLWG